MKPTTFSNQFRFQTSNAAMKIIRVLLADDHRIVREGLKQLFKMVDDIVIVGETTCGTETLNLLKTSGGTPYDVLLADMNMPGISGHELLSRIHGKMPHLPILVLSMHADVQYVRHALSIGASGYMTKGCDMKMLFNAIREVAAGRNFIDPALAAQMFFKEARKEGPPHRVLSEREFQVLTLLADGNSLIDVADQLCISRKTVSTHKARLMEKMGFNTNVDLVRYAVKYRLTV